MNCSLQTVVNWYSCFEIHCCHWTVDPLYRCSECDQKRVNLTISPHYMLFISPFHWKSFGLLACKIFRFLYFLAIQDRLKTEFYAWLLCEVSFFGIFTVKLPKKCDLVWAVCYLFRPLIFIIFKFNDFSRS